MSTACQAMSSLSKHTAVAAQQRCTWPTPCTTFEYEQTLCRLKSMRGRAALVGVCMVVVVLDAPGLKRVDERHEHERANDVLHQFVFTEAAVSAVVAYYKQLHPTADGSDVCHTLAPYSEVQKA